jgi:hypothetical protein
MVRLACWKTALSKPQKQTVPHLKLNAVLQAAQLAHKVSQYLKIDNVTLWTDSTTTLQWLAWPPKTWKTYIGNRVAQIMDFFPSMSWKHVPADENPADLASCGVIASKLLNCKHWFHGPVFLREDKKLWPTSPILEKDNPNVMKEQQPYFPIILVQMASYDLLKSIFGVA